MTERNLDELLDAWLASGPTLAPQRVAEAARLEARSSRQATPVTAWLPRRIPISSTAARLISASAAVTVAAIVGYSFLAPPNVSGPRVDPEPDAALPINNLDVVPTPVAPEEGMAAEGPVLQIARGEARSMVFTVTVYRWAEREGVCMVLATPREADGGCGPPPGEGLPEFGRFGGMSDGELRNGMVEAHGIVAPDVERVWVVTDDGRRANALLVPFVLDDVEASFFVVFLAAGTQLRTTVAADGSGAVLTEIPVAPVEPGGDGAVPGPGGVSRRAFGARPVRRPDRPRAGGSRLEGRSARPGSRAG
jgi:hypothetical protein